jgi:4-diphosphocytidyl-2-C-methyl-D-erythritol kinase
MRKRLDEPSADGSPVRGGPLVEFARAKINLTLAVEGRRADGFHEIASLVVFASIGDELSLLPDRALSLEVTGPFADGAGAAHSNLVLKAATALARHVPGLRQGGFLLEKRLPAAAGLGGGSADAAAALRLLARLNGLSLESAAILEAAREIGSDVPVCLSGGCRMMAGRGEILGRRLTMPRLCAVLVNPGVRLETARVFAALASRGGSGPSRKFTAPAELASRRDWLKAIALCDNDLEAPAIGLAPDVHHAKQRLSVQPGCVLARMSGSGATVFGLFEEEEAAETAARAITAEEPGWWTRKVMLNG